MRIVKFKNGVETVLLKDYTTFPRWNSHCASRILLNLKNLLVYRGINETNTMIGPIEYFGQIDPYSSIFYPDKNKEILPDPPFFNCQKFEWKKNSIGNTKGSLFPDSGELILNESEIDIPIISTGYNLSSFNVRLVPSEKVTYDVSLKQKKLFSISYFFSKNYYKYAIENDGIFVEKHPFIQAMTPVDENSSGFIIVGRIQNFQLHLVGIKIPLGFTLLIDSNAIHGDSTFSGMYRMEMTADHVEMAKADTVYLKNKQGQNVKLKIDEESSSSILFPNNSENVKWPKLIFNPIW
jgi:hypothetical protein